MTARFFLLFLLCFNLLGCQQTEQNSHLQAAPPQRIITTCPSVTETLCALGLEERLVGVSKFCQYPDSVRSLPQVGGYLDPDYEAILELAPDLVVLLKENTAMQEKLSSLEIPWLAVDHQTIEGVMDSFGEVARYCGVAPQGEQLVSEMNARLEEMASKKPDSERPKVMLALRMTPEQRIQTVTVAGSNPFFRKALEYAGGRNALDQSRTPFPIITREAVHDLNPDIIIDLIPSDMAAHSSDFARSWEDFGDAIQAVKNGRIYQISDDYAMIPGPRFLFFIEKLNQIIEPHQTAQADPFPSKCYPPLDRPRTFETPGTDF